MNKLCILGAGSWGTAQSILLTRNGHKVVMWAGPDDDVDAIMENRENQRYLPGVKIPDSLVITRDMEEAVGGATAVILAVPSQSFREVCVQLQYYIKSEMLLINTAKGLEISSGMRLSQVAQDVLGENIQGQFAVLSGPSHAEEVAREMPTVVTAAAYHKDTAFMVQDIFMSPVFRVYTNPDVPGVELGGALKNVMALATGIVQGLEYGDNITAALMTRGLAEMTRMGSAMGGDRRTFNGLSGMGDLVVTCCSRHSRNRRAGELIGKGYSLEDCLNTVGMVVEGAHTTRVLYHLAADMNVDLPITRACYDILYNHAPPRKAVEGLMKRRKKHEIEEIISDSGSW
ncbi:glycerol-3-phosphate dehydrogenase [hydrocarbon metagenome]|uniref:Glycerol-3-phosphate dehydrogenase n=1 Tax=hydrocarbon metagenome TaxID=938273 RepID=A0A0W8E634_9ZZZZ